MRLHFIWIGLVVFLSLVVGISINRASQNNVETACITLADQRSGKLYIADPATGKVFYDPRQPFPPPPGPAQYTRNMSPDGNYALFYVDRAQKAEPTWIAKRSYPKQIMLLPPLGSIEDFAWSPDSKHLAYVSFAFENNQSIMSFVVSDADGTNAHIETLNGSPGNRQLEWSPNGAYVAATLQQSSGSLLLIYPIADSKVQQYSFPSADFYQAPWSWSGDHFLVAVPGVLNNPHWKIYIIDAWHTTILEVPTSRDVTPVSRLSTVIGWSPDGQYFFMAYRTDSSRDAFDVYSLDGKAIMTGQEGRIDSWSSDSHRLMFYTAAAALQSYDQLWSLDVVDGTARSITDHVMNRVLGVTLPSGNVFLQGPKPDGKKVVDLLDINSFASRTLVDNIAALQNISVHDRKLLITSTVSHADKIAYQLTWTDIDGANPHSIEVPPALYHAVIDHAGWLSDDTIYFSSSGGIGMNTMALLNTKTLQWIALASDVMSTDVSFASENKEILIAWQADGKYGVDGYDFTGKRLFRFTSNTFSFLNDMGYLGHLYVSPDRRSVLTYHDHSAGGVSGTIGLTDTQGSQVIWQRTKSENQVASNPAWSADSTMFAFTVSIGSAEPSTVLQIFAADGTQRRQIAVDTNNVWPSFTVGWSNCR